MRVFLEVEEKVSTYEGMTPQEVAEALMDAMGEGFKPPDIEGLLRKQGWEGEDGR